MKKKSASKKSSAPALDGTLEIKSISIDLVKPYWRNPRKNENAVDAVVESIKEFGMNVPLVVDKEHVILTGHTRYKALRRLGVKEIPVIVVDLPERKARQFRIADNKTHEFSEWDVDKLKLELEELMDSAKEKATLSKVFGEANWTEMLALSSLLPDADSLAGVGKKTKGTAEGGAFNKGATVTVICPHCLEDNVLTAKDFVDAA